MLSVSGADASGGNTRSHPEHDREEPDGRRYYAGDGMGEQAGARIKKYFVYIKGGLIAQQVRAHA